MTILLSRDFARKMLHTVSVCDYAFAVDEPPDIGGEDAGFTPRDVFDSVLGACKALTVLWYARRKQMPLEDGQVSVDRDDSGERQSNYRLRVTLARYASARRVNFGPLSGGFAGVNRASRSSAWGRLRPVKAKGSRRSA